MNPYLISVVAKEHEAEIQRRAEQARLAQAASGSPGRVRTRNLIRSLRGRYLNGADAGYKQPLHRTGRRARRA
jgi:hypothetical protein